MHASPGRRPGVWRSGGPGLHVRSLVAMAYGLLTAGIAAVTAGFAASQPALTGVGGRVLGGGGQPAGQAAAVLLRVLPRPDTEPATAPGWSTPST